MNNISAIIQKQDVVEPHETLKNFNHQTNFNHTNEFIRRALFPMKVFRIKTLLSLRDWGFFWILF